MTDETYTFPKLANGLFGLPPNFDLKSLFKSEYADEDMSESAIRHREYDRDHGMTAQHKRERAFYIINEFVAENSAGDDDVGALAKLAAALGAPVPTATADKSTATSENARIRARLAARKACTAALQGGYRP